MSWAGPLERKTFMKLHRTAFFLSGLAVVCACSATNNLSAASGSDGSAGTHVTGTAGAGTGTAGAVDAGGGAAGTGATGAAGSTSVGGMTASVACTSYCTTVMANCTGANQQYADMANCLKVCAYIPVGTPTDDGVNTVGCWANEATAAAIDPTEKCYAAGPLGYGACGDFYGFFCSVALTYCSAASGYTGTAPYTSMNDCYDTFGSLYIVVPSTAAEATPGLFNSMWNPGPNPTPEVKDTVECRFYYLFIEALQSTANQQMYCPDVAIMSATCGPGFYAPLSTDAGTTGSDAAVSAYDGSPVGGG
jgi:hypothetical protein